MEGRTQKVRQLQEVEVHGDMNVDICSPLLTLLLAFHDSCIQVCSGIMSIVTCKSQHPQGLRQANDVALASSVIMSPRLHIMCVSSGLPTFSILSMM